MEKYIFNLELLQMWTWFWGYLDSLIDIYIDICEYIELTQFSNIASQSLLLLFILWLKHKVCLKRLHVKHTQNPVLIFN